MFGSEMGTMKSGEGVMRGNEEKIFVSVRLRPLNSKEILRNDVLDWECIDDKTVVYKNVNLSASERSMYPSAYTFDRVFRSACSTKEVYEQGAKDVAISAVSGMNSSVFAYGQTSSGKTYTMTGITEYAISDIFDYIEKHPERKYSLKFSAMEIYNESVRDLLSVDSTPLRLLDDPERGTIIEKLTEEVLTDWDHVIQLLSICEAQRQIGETSLNETSSRSHQIIRLTVESSSNDFLGKDNATTLSAAVNFVDLAGSERASQSLSAGARLKEGCHINRSLLTLGTVVRKLSKGRNGHIPYRDSKLTRILQTSLGGNARTAIICTMSPARSHVEQSRNTLLFASCAKEVTTNAQVNVVMSDKALVKHLQRELARLEIELRRPSSAFRPSNYSATMREKDLRIEELEKEIKEVILQRDIIQSQMKELLQMLGDGSGSIIQVGLGHYPQMQAQNLLDSEIPELETPIMVHPHSLDVDTRTCSDGHSGSSSVDHKVPYFDYSFVPGNMSPRILIRSSNFSESDSCHDWNEIEEQSNGTSEYLYKEVCCIDAEESSNKGILYSSPKENTGFSAVRESLNGDEQSLEFESPPLTKEQILISSHLKSDSEMKEGTGSKPTSAKSDELISPSTFKKERELDFFDMASLEKLCLTRDLAQDLSSARSLKLTKSQSFRESIIAGSSSPWLKITDYSEKSPSSGSYKEFKGFHANISPLNFGSCVQTLQIIDSQSSRENAFDIEIATKNVKFLNAEDVSCGINDIKEEDLMPDEQEKSRDSAKEIEWKVNKSLKKSVKEAGLNPIEDDTQGLSSWPMEFKRLQREIIELWQACNVSLVHRSYFFMLFQGDPSDSIYLEVEMRRMKFLNDKFSNGEMTIVNGQCLTVASSDKTLRQERCMLSKQMSKKLSQRERESLFLKWGIGLNTKLRKLKLAYHIWANTKDMNHIADSAFLVVKLVGLIEPGQAPKEMFGLNFTPRYSARNYSFRRSLTSLL